MAQIQPNFGRYGCSDFVIAGKEAKIFNKNIFPATVNTSSDNILQLIQNNIELIYPSDISVFTIAYKQLMDTVNADSFNPIELVLRFKNHKELYNAYNFIFYKIKGSDNKQIISGHIYEMGIDIAIVTDSPNIQVQNDFTNFANHVKDTLIQHSHHKYAIIEFDIEKFKIINELHGEKFGDNVIANITKCCSLFLNGYENFVRANSDVFVMLVSYTTKANLIEQIRVWEKRLNTYNNVSYKLNWGVYIINDPSLSVRSMVDNTSIARMNIKGNALNNIGFYDESQRQEIKNLKLIEEKANDALRNKEFKMFLQPQYNIQTQKIVGAESLVRWVDYDGNITQPDMFIPIFEKNGFITRLDQFMWEEACKLLNKWEKNHMPMVPISVNISRKHLDKMDFVEYLERLIAKYKINKKYLKLEITETLDNSHNCDSFAVLKDHGFELLMDDFGSGYSSLNTLKDTNFDVIKIDKGFLSEFMCNPKGKAIMSHTIAMINSIHLNIIAEGVETEAQASFLKENGCNIAQGFLYSKPISIARFEELLRKEVQK